MMNARRDIAHQGVTPNVKDSIRSAAPAMTGRQPEGLLAEHYG
jgi:hypothetical protein